MSGAPNALSAKPSPRPSHARAARLETFRREQLIVDYLNRVAIQVSRLSEALLNAFSAMSPSNLKAVDQVVKIVRELDRYGGAFAGEWARPEASQLDATADEDAAFASAWLQGDEPALQDLETAPLGLAGGNRPENPTQGLEKLEFAPGNLSAADHSAIERSGEPRPLAPHSASRDGRLSTPYARQEGRFADLIRGMRLGCLAADARPSPPAGLDAGLDREANPLPAGEKGPVCERPENPPQSLDKIESAPGIATGLETAATAPAGPLPPPGLFPALPKDANARSDVAVRSALRDTTRLASRLAVPEVWPAAPAAHIGPQNPPQMFENIESAPENGWIERAASGFGEGPASAWRSWARSSPDARTSA